MMHGPMNVKFSHSYHCRQGQRTPSSRAAACRTRRAWHWWVSGHSTCGTWRT